MNNERIRMNRQQCLEYSVLHWERIVLKMKEGEGLLPAKGIAINELIKEGKLPPFESGPRCNCFCCEYVYEGLPIKEDCKKCPALSIWYKGKIPKEIKGNPCILGKSPYYLAFTNDSRIDCAEEIRDGFKKLLEDSCRH